MKKAILLLALVTSSFVCLAQSGVYKRVDQDGHTIYSDFQTQEAKEIDLPEITVMPAASSSVIPLAKRGATAQSKQHEVLDKNIDLAIDPTHGSGTAQQLPADQAATQLSDHDRVQQLIEDMALYADSIETLEIELYNLEGGY